MASAGAPFPAPGAGLHATLITWPAGQLIYRVHDAACRSRQFNPTRGSARFSPIATRSGKAIATLYGGGTFECAVMETVFHDVPYAPGFKTYDKDKLTGKRVSVISPSRALQLINLAAVPLRKLGITRKHLIESDAVDYPLTRPWAVALHEQFPQADGLYWVSRQDDEGRSLMLFGDRLKPVDLDEIVAPDEIVGNPALYGQLLALAQQIGVNIV
jgi:hypothetical protein